MELLLTINTVVGGAGATEYDPDRERERAQIGGGLRSLGKSDTTLYGVAFGAVSCPARGGKLH